MILAANLLGCALFLPFLLDALVRLRDDARWPADAPIAFGLGALVFGATLLTRGLEEMASLHWFGAAFLAMTLGYAAALPVAGAIVVASTAPVALGPALLIDALMPVWAACLLVALGRRYLPANPFVFLLGCGFFGLFLVGALQLTCGLLIARWLPTGPALAPSLADQLGFGLLLVAGQATLEGMLLTVLVVYAPRAVRLFDDEHYLSGGQG